MIEKGKLLSPVALLRALDIVWGNEKDFAARKAADDSITADHAERIELAAAQAATIARLRALCAEAAQLVEDLDYKQVADMQYHGRIEDLLARLGPYRPLHHVPYFQVRPVGAAGLDAVLADVVTWGCATFPESTDSGKTKHLLKECAELDAHPSDAGEMADVLMILAHLAAAHDVDLAAAVREKLAICKARKRGKPDADGVVEHLRAEGETPT